jgi:hypothetical protein
MEEKRNVLPPPSGYVNALAKLCGCNRSTVFNALKRNAKGQKAEMVRRMYRTKYAGGRPA